MTTTAIDELLPSASRRAAPAKTSKRAATRASTSADDLFGAAPGTVAAEAAASDPSSAVLEDDDSETPAVPSGKRGGKRSSTDKLAAAATIRRAAAALGTLGDPSVEEAELTLGRDRIRSGSAAADGTLRQKAARIDADPVERPSGELYYPRMIGEQVDIEVMRTCRANGLHVSLEGFPGGGKTALVEAAFGEDLLTVEGNSDAEVSDFTGSWTPLPDGTYEWLWGPLVTAMREGRPLFVDDGTVINPGVWVRLYPAMDGRGRINVREYRNEVVQAAPGFVVILAHNPGAPGAMLSPALASRFPLHIGIKSDLKLAQEKLGIDPKIVMVADALHRLRGLDEGSWAPETRDLVQFQQVKDALGLPIALGNMINQAPEQSRTVVQQQLSVHFGSAAVKALEIA